MRHDDKLNRVVEGGGGGGGGRSEGGLLMIKLYTPYTPMPNTQRSRLWLRL